MKGKILLLAGAALLGACSSSNEAENGQLLANAADANAAAVAPVDNALTPGNEAAEAVAPPVEGFDPNAAPLATGTLGGWPYFSIMDGYERGDKNNMMSYESKKWLEDVKYERFEFWDGKKLIPVEGRAFVVRALGDAASFFQIQKTYEKLIKDLGGVTVYEGTGESMAEQKLKFADQRYRGQYFLKYDKMGVYMARFANKQVWVEVYQPWDDSKGYWLTVMETIPLQMTAKMLDAEAMKSALDANGHVALYINFDTDKTAIKPEAQPIVAEIVKLMNDNPGLKLEVQGHTDNQGDAGHNMTLSSGRANSVVGALMAAGVPLDRLSPKGYGQTKPIADNASEDGRAKNRRVELVKR